MSKIMYVQQQQHCAKSSAVAHLLQCGSMHILLADWCWLHAIIKPLYVQQTEVWLEWM
jgi:hypothetical protein